MAHNNFHSIKEQIKMSFLEQNNNTSVLSSKGDEPTSHITPSSTIHMSPTKGDRNTMHQDECSSSPTKTSSSMGVQRQQRLSDQVTDMSDLEYCEDLVVATAIYETETEDASNDGYLPTCVEYDPDSKQGHRVKFYRRMICAILIAIGIVIGTVIMAINMVSSKDDVNNENEWMREEIESHLGTTIDELSVNNDESYKKALNWLMTIDPLRTEFATDSSSNIDNLFQRFILASMYYGTSIDTEWAYCAPPQINDESSCSYEQPYFGKEQTKSSNAFRWLSDTPTCQWAGINCNVNNEVDAISLDLFKLSGTFPHQIQYLSSLTFFSVYDSNLRGPLPKDLIGRLPNLEELLLEKNQLSGSIPNQWFIDAQSSSGPQKLKKLSINFAQLTGTIPSDIQLFTSLTTLTLSNNRLHGTIPEALFMDQLEALNLSFNQLTGIIPTVIGQCTSLIGFAVSSNLLHGSIPREIGQTYKRLDSIELSNNMFTGTIPDEIYTLSMLFCFDVASNQFHGTIKPTIGRKLTLLEVLHIRDNKFTGTIPSTLKSLRDFTYDENFLNGTMPKGLCQFLNNEKCCTTYDCCTLDGNECPSI